MKEGRGSDRERKKKWVFFFILFQFRSLVFAMLHLSFVVSVAKSWGQGLQIHHNYSNLSPPHHRATTACLPHICLEAALLHNHLRFNYRAMIAMSFNKDREKALVNLHAFLFLHSSTSFNANTVPRGCITPNKMGLNFLNFDYHPH